MTSRQAHHKADYGLTGKVTEKRKPVITLWPYRSLSLKGFRIFMASLASLMSLIATGFYLLGAWPVIGFLGQKF